VNGLLRIPVVLAAGVIVSSATVSASGGRPLPCLAGMRAALVRGRFTGPLICNRNDASFILVGRTTGNNFTIYDYRYRYLPVGGNVMHGGQKMVVFRKNVYVGQLSLSPPPYATATVNGTYIALQKAGASKVEFDLKRVPIDNIVFDGEVVTFSR
jgi:hypothetical protein